MTTFIHCIQKHWIDKTAIFLHALLLRNFSVYTLRYTLSLTQLERSARMAVFRKENLVKTREGSSTKKVSKIYVLLKRLGIPELVSFLAARKCFHIFFGLRARALARRDHHGRLLSCVTAKPNGSRSYKVDS